MQAILTSTARPTFFMAALATRGYASAARELARHVATLGPDDATSAEWAAELQNLAALIPSSAFFAPDVRGVRVWLERHMPGIMGAMPGKARRLFAERFCSIVQSEEIDIVNG